MREMKGLRLIITWAALAGVALRAQTPATTFTPCAQARQKIEVPEQIHLVSRCQVTPEVRPILPLLFSENGIEVYRLEFPPKKGSKPEGSQRADARVASDTHYPFTVSALLVFQSEDARGKEFKALASSSAVSWYGGYDDPMRGWQEDLGSIVSFKYETDQFVWLNERDVLLVRADLYAPLGCMTHVAPPSQNFNCGSPDVESTEVGAYVNPSPPELPQGSFLYRVAAMLADGRRPGQALP